MKKHKDWWVICDKDDIPKLVYPDKEWAKDRVAFQEGGCLVAVNHQVGRDTWWVIARKDNQYPTLIYPTKEVAEPIAQVNDCLLESVSPVIGQTSEIERNDDARSIA